MSKRKHTISLVDGGDNGPAPFRYIQKFLHITSFCRRLFPIKKIYMFVRQFYRLESLILSYQSSIIKTMQQEFPRLEKNRYCKYIQKKGQKMADTNLAQAVEATESSTSYDTNIKFLLADKQILARILKYAVREFKDMSIEDIINSIDDDIGIGTQPLDAGLSNIGRISGANTEDNIPGEGKVFFDIRFSAYHKKTEIKFLINLEAQKSADPSKLGYHLENRIIFYLARMISAQKQTEFYHSDYDNLKKVRSIWLCLDNREDGDSIEEISQMLRTFFKLS